MKTFYKLAMLVSILTGPIFCQAQEIQTLLDTTTFKSLGGYGAVTNKFTWLGGQFANMSGLYGGLYINHRFMLGISGAAVNNDVPVPEKYSLLPGKRMSYEYGQFGLMTEYVLKSNKAIHVGLQLFGGMGFNTQYQRYQYNGNDDDQDQDFDDFRSRADWFIVTEPGVNVEVNILKWMRFCPGVSYRVAFDTSDPINGLKAADISGASLNAALKFGKF